MTCRTTESSGMTYLTHRALKSCVVKTASIGYTTSMVAVEIRVPSRGMRQTDVHMEKERASDDKCRLHKAYVGRTII